MNKSIRFVSVLALVAAAAASQAVSIFISGLATGVTSSTGNYSGIVNSNLSDSPFSTVALGSTFTESLNGATSTASYVGSSAASGFTISFNGTPDNTGTGVASFSSNAVITAATGTFAPYLGFTGIVTGSTANLSSGYQMLSLSGNLTPEPASFAALGVGAIALIRRRRKA